MHNEPVSVRKSLVAVVLLLLVSSILLASLLASAWKTKKEKEQVAPVTNQKVMPQTIDHGVNTPARRKQVDQKKDAANEAVLLKYGLSVQDGGHAVSVKQ